MRASDHPLGFTPEQFWTRVVRTEDSCWFWTGSHSVGGYGQLTTWDAHEERRVNRLAHRMAWELLVGPIPDGMEINHTCRNRNCCRPAHLQIVTPAENKRDAARAGRRPIAADTWAAEVRALLDTHGMTQIELARALGVSESTVSTWVCGKVAAHRSTRERLRDLVACLEMQSEAA